MPPPKPNSRYSLRSTSRMEPAASNEKLKLSASNKKRASTQKPKPATSNELRKPINTDGPLSMSSNMGATTSIKKPSLPLPTNTSLQIMQLLSTPPEMASPPPASTEEADTISSQETATPQPCYLLSIPAELRLEIYGLAFSNHSLPFADSDLLFVNNPSRLRDPPLLSTCKAIRAEAIQTYQLQLVPGLRGLKESMEDYRGVLCTVKKGSDAELRSHGYDIISYFKKQEAAFSEFWLKGMKMMEAKIERLEGEGLVVLRFEDMMKRG